MVSDGLGGMPAWAEGACICLFGSTLTALGLVLQKMAHTAKAEEDLRRESAQPAKQEDVLDQGSEEKSYFLQPWWLIGFLLYTAAQIINMVSMAMTPQVVLSCLGSWTLVCNTVFAHLLLGEKVGRCQAMAVAALVASTALVLVCAPRPPGEDPDMDKLLDRFCSPDFLLLSLVFVGLASFARGLVVRSGGEAGAGGPDASRGPLQIVTEEQEPPQLAQVSVPVAWAFIAATYSGYTALFFKCVAELVAAASQDYVQLLTRWQAYAILGAGLSCAPSELHCLNKALATGNAVFVVPMYLAMGMLAQLVTGAVFFQELRYFASRTDALLFAFSVTFAMCSVVGMAIAQVEAIVDSLPPADDTAQVTSFMATNGSAMSAASDVRQPLLTQVSGSEDLLVTPMRITVAKVSKSGFGGAIESLDRTAVVLRSRPETPLSPYLATFPNRHWSSQNFTNLPSDPKPFVRHSTL